MMFFITKLMIFFQKIKAMIHCLTHIVEVVLKVTFNNLILF
jgi:hypothetical protein